MKSVFKKIALFIDSNPWIFFSILLLVGLYLRFYHIQDFQAFHWDQARDAWKIRDILNGQLTLIGPKTGVGSLHLGPIYYYLLAPFFLITHMDPVGSIYFNFLANIFNFIVIFYVAKKIFNNYVALFVIYIYTFSNYIIAINQVPWNVTLMPGVAAAIFYSIIQVYKEKYKWVFVIWGLSGFYFNLHFTALFLPFINILSLLFVKDKRIVIKYSILSIPLYFIWFLPPLIYLFTTADESDNLKHFVGSYYIGLHLKFFLTKRLVDSLVQFKTITHIEVLKNYSLSLPLIYAVIAFFDKNNWNKKIAYLTLLWFVVPALCFTLYGGPVSEYYFLYTVPMVLFVISYIHEKILSTKFRDIALILLSVFWIFYAWQNTNDIWIKPHTGGLESQKAETRQIIKENREIKFDVGDIRSYLYQVWVIDKK